MPVELLTPPKRARSPALPESLADVQHFVFEDASWALYEKMVNEAGDGTIRLTYDDGRLEIMSPRPEHESAKKTIARFIEALALETGKRFISYGSTTFKKKGPRKGLEPDDCYYFKNLKKMRGRKKIDLSVDPAPDLALEIDVTSRSVEREPIYAALGVPEIWRWRDEKLECRILKGKSYVTVVRSIVFPFLKPSDLARFVHFAAKTDDLTAVMNFTAWVRSNGWGPTTRGPGVGES